MRLATFTVCLFFVSAGVTYAAPSSLPPAAAATGEQFLTQLKQGNVSEAYHFAFHEVESQMGSQAIDSVSGQTSSLLKTFGGIIEWETYQTDIINSHFIRQTYFIRCSTIPLFVTVLFYDVGKGWHIIDVQLNSYNNGRNAGFYDAVPAGRY